MVYDFEKTTDEPTNSPTELVRSASDSLPTAEQWKQVGAATLNLTQGTLAGLWATLRPIVANKSSDDEFANSETVPLVDKSENSTNPTDDPFPTLHQWAETGKTVIGLTKRTADALFQKPVK